ncbi:SRPBCC family protein [Mycobacterium sp. pUA109]|uniref:SRPBCC family protein n=1 Tax=Mycobacterium sp. pUA109 TaxID=3238982 RepID=UPI00351B5A5A
MRELIKELERARRAVGDGELRGQAAYVVELRRRLRAPIAEVWDACTDPDRVCRWFLPMSGDLRPGGRFQFEGNAGGAILACEPPSQLQVTWECGDLQPGLVTLELTPAGDDATELVLRHTVPDDDQWAQFGPGAVGVGWDMPLAVLAVLVTGAEIPTSGEFMNDPATPVLMRHSSAAWGAAHRAAGVSPDSARDAAANTSAFYAPE